MGGMSSCVVIALYGIAHCCNIAHLTGGFNALSETRVRFLNQVFHSVSFYSYNGGICVDGVNWFRCECAPGFAGPDCRISESLGTRGGLWLGSGGREVRGERPPRGSVSRLFRGDRLGSHLGRRS